MKQKTLMTLIATALTVTLMSVGYFAVSAEYGTKDDPVVTLSYITAVLEPSMKTEIDELLTEKLNEYDISLSEKLDEYYSEIDTQVSILQSNITNNSDNAAFIQKVAEELAGIDSEKSSEFSVVTVQSGEKLIGQVGTEILLRYGNATVYATYSPGLVNTTAGTTLDNGGVLIANNLYLVTIADHGFTATEKVTALVKGDYVIK